MTLLKAHGAQRCTSVIKEGDMGAEEQFRMCEDCRFAVWDVDDFGRTSYDPEDCRKHVPEPFWNEEAECYDCNCHEEIEDVRW